MPLVSVVIPVWNRGARLGPTLESVLAQSEPDIEVLVVNDGSTDHTRAWLEEHLGADPRVRLFRLENGGVARARNFGLAQARGEFIAFLDHDDLWKPDKLRLQLAKMKDPRVGVVYCSWTSVDEDGREMPPVIQFQRQKWWWKPPRGGRAFPWILLPHPLQFSRNPLISMSIPLIRTRLLRDIGGFDEAIVPSDDWDVWIRLSKVCRFAFVNQELTLYVHHSGQQHKQLKSAFESVLKIHWKHQVSWTKHPWVRFKQECSRRSSRAMLHYADAQEDLSHGRKHRIVSSTLKAFFWRPDILLLRRWHRLWLRALQNNREPF